MSALAALLPHTPTFLDDFTPDSGLALRRWTPDEFRRMTADGVLGAGEGLELAGGELVTQADGSRACSAGENTTAWRSGAFLGRKSAQS